MLVINEKKRTKNEKIEHSDPYFLWSAWDPHNACRSAISLSFFCCFHVELMSICFIFCFDKGNICWNIAFCFVVPYWKVFCCAPLKSSLLIPSVFLSTLRLNLCIEFPNQHCSWSFLCSNTDRNLICNYYSKMILQQAAGIKVGHEWMYAHFWLFFFPVHVSQNISNVQYALAQK